MQSMTIAGVVVFIVLCIAHTYVYVHTHIHICILSCLYTCNSLTIQDILISNPFKSAGVVVLEIIVLFTTGGSKQILCTDTIYVRMYNSYVHMYVCKHTCLYIHDTTVIIVGYMCVYEAAKHVHNLYVRICTQYCYTVPM